MQLTAEQIKEVNKTCRSTGAVGKNAIVPKLVKQLAKDLPDHLSILDYGAGKHAIHAQELTHTIGPSIYMWEIGDNFDPLLHDEDALSGKRLYRIVYASNVLNVLPSGIHIGQAIKEMAAVLEPGGFLIVNYPKEPRKSGEKIGYVEKILQLMFETVLRDGTVFMCISKEDR